MMGEFVVWLGHTLITICVVVLIGLPLLRWEHLWLPAGTWWIERWYWTWPLTFAAGGALTWIGWRI